jgi:ABC-type spermidine/putrescine transport system permease subunit I
VSGPRGYVANLTADLGHRVVLLGTGWGILIGMVAAYLPIMTLPVDVALSRVSDDLVAAARDLGAGEWRIMRTLLIPGAAPGFAAGAVLVGSPPVASTWCRPCSAWRASSRCWPADRAQRAPPHDVPT